MTTATKPTTVRLDEPERAIALELLSGMGLSLNAYLNMAIHQLVNLRRIPFDVIAAAEQPDKEVHRASKASETEAPGLISDDELASRVEKRQRLFERIDSRKLPDFPEELDPATIVRQMRDER